MLVLSLTVVLSLLATLAVGLYWWYWRWTHKEMLELSKKLPGPKPLPLLGNAHIFIAKPTQMLNVLSKLMEKYGEYMQFWIGPELNVCVRNPHDIRQILTSSKVNLKGPCYEVLKPIIGPGILTGGPTWRNHRKIANPSYNKKSVLAFSNVFNEQGRILTKVLLNKDPTKTFNVFTDVLNATTKSVCLTLMGLSEEDSKSIAIMPEVVRETQNIYTMMFLKMTRWWYQIPPIYQLMGEQKREDYYAMIVDRMVTEIVDRRKKALADKNITSLDQIEDDSPGIVDRYILSGELSYQEIKWETMTLFTTSQEAAAKITSAVLLFLAHLPDWQEKVYNEILEVLGPNDNDVTDEDVKKLLYLDMVYKEVLRYLSIAAMIQRRVDEPIEIDNGNLTLPKGTLIVLPIHEVHRDPKYWEEPNKVMPERFMPENTKIRDPNAFIPFSLGPMDCLGRVYATALIKTMVVHIVRNVEFEADGKLEDLELHVAISVRFSKGYNLRARPRKSAKDRIHA